MLDALKQQRRLTVADLSAQLHITDAATRATVEVLLEAGLVEARGSSTARSYMLSGKVYSQSGKEAGYVRQSDIDKVRYPELIMKLAKRQGGSIATRVCVKLGLSIEEAVLFTRGKEKFQVWQRRASL